MPVKTAVVANCIDFQPAVFLAQFFIYSIQKFLSKRWFDTMQT